MPVTVVSVPTREPGDRCGPGHPPGRVAPGPRGAGKRAVRRPHRRGARGYGRAPTRTALCWTSSDALTQNLLKRPYDVGLLDADPIGKPSQGAITDQPW